MNDSDFNFVTGVSTPTREQLGNLSDSSLVNPTGNPSQMTIQDLRVFIGRQIGLPLSFDGSYSATQKLTPDQFQALTRGMLNYIVANPGRFNDAQVATARAEVNRANSNGLVDASFSFSDFGSEVANNANDLVGKPLQSIGQGFSDALKLVGPLLPVILIGAVVVFALPYLKNASK